MHLFGADMQDDKAKVGAILLAEGLAGLRDLGAVARGLAKGGRRG